MPICSTRSRCIVPIISPVNHSALKVQSSIYLLAAGLSVADSHCFYDPTNCSFPDMKSLDLSFVLDMLPFYRRHNPYCPLAWDFFFHLTPGDDYFAEKDNFAEHPAR
ncbi:hypothetical protein BT93_G0166 [Corymbia citriodora subsp. variegata]|nr:hypothetical protein BT93_G0166 [Corymbia citriodora subsp. variegata]